jgi:hypothetical protein
MPKNDFDRLEKELRSGTGHARPLTPEELEERRRRWAVSPQRASFDTALNVLLIRENLAGAEWAIQQLREAAAAAQRVADATDDNPEMGRDSKIMAKALEVAALTLEQSLDKRSAELATREG